MADCEPMVEFEMIAGPRDEGTGTVYRARIGDVDCAIITKTPKGFFTCRWVDQFADIDMTKYYDELRFKDMTEVIEEEVELFYKNKDKPKPPLNSRERRNLFNEMCEVTKLVRDARYACDQAEKKAIAIIKTLRDNGIID